MTRKNFAQRLKDTDVDFNVEYARLFYLFFEDSHMYETIDIPLFYSVRDIISKALSVFSFRGTALNLDEFDKEYHYSFRKKTGGVDKDQLIDLCEYCFNLCHEYYVKVILNRNITTWNNQIVSLLNHIGELTNKINVTKINEGGIFIFVEKIPAAVSVSEQLDDEHLSFVTLQYNHHSMKGDIETKRAVLNKMAQYLEPKRQMLKSVNQTLERDLFQIFNRFNIRHNNIDPSDAGKFNPKCADMSDEELEALYDDTYQMWLLAVLELDNVERQKRLEKYWK